MAGRGVGGGVPVVIGWVGGDGGWVGGPYRRLWVVRISNRNLRKDPGVPGRPAATLIAAGGSHFR